MIADVYWWLFEWLIAPVICAVAGHHFTDWRETIVTRYRAARTEYDEYRVCIMCRREETRHVQLN